MTLNSTRLSQFILFLIVILTLAGCETMGGAGRDIEHAGDAVQDAASN